MKLFDFNIGAKIQCQDGQEGKLSGVVVDPKTQQVTSLIVEKGFWLTQNRVLPISVVQKTTKDEVYLSISSGQLDLHPEYRVEEYEEPAADPETAQTPMPSPQGFQYGMVEPVVPMVKKTVRKGIVPGQVVIETGIGVSTIMGEIGKVEHVIVDSESEAITHLVVRRGLIFSEQLMVPISAIETMSEEGIFVSCTSKEVELLPLYNDKELDLVK